MFKSKCQLLKHSIAWEKTHTKTNLLWDDFDKDKYKKRRSQFYKDWLPHTVHDFAEGVKTGLRYLLNLSQTAARGTKVCSCDCNFLFSRVFTAAIHIICLKCSSIRPDTALFRHMLHMCGKETAQMLIGLVCVCVCVCVCMCVCMCLTSDYVVSAFSSTETAVDLNKQKRVCCHWHLKEVKWWREWKRTEEDRRKPNTVLTSSTRLRPDLLFYLYFSTSRVSNSSFPVQGTTRLDSLGIILFWFSIGNIHLNKAYDPLSKAFLAIDTFGFTQFVHSLPWDRGVCPECLFCLIHFLIKFEATLACLLLLTTLAWQFYLNLMNNCLRSWLLSWQRQSLWKTVPAT